MDLQEVLKNTKDSYDIAGEEYFNLFHDELDKHFWDKELLATFAKELPRGAKVCDLGCGPAAQYTEYLASFDLQTYGIDLSLKNIQLAQKKNPHLIFRCEDMLHTSFLDSSIDAVVSFYALFHIPKEYDNKFFKEVNRILKPGGRLLLMTHKGDTEETLTHLWNHKDLSLFINFHNEKEVINSAKAEGLQIEACYSKESYYPFPKERIILKAIKL